MTLNLAVTLEESAKACPNKTALISGEYKMSYAELRRAAKKFAGGLVSVGVKPGAKVALMAPNVPQWVAAYYGILNMGATVVPLNVLLKASEVAYHLEDSDAVALVVWEDFLEEAEKAHKQVAGCEDLIVIEKPDGAGALEGTHGYNEFLAENPAEFEMVQTDPNETAVLIYTSGTTGRPKGAELTHFNVLMNVMVVADWLFEITEGDVALGALPLFNVFGQNGVLNSLLYKGATVVLLPCFEPEAALETIQRARVTMFHGVPTMYQSLLRYPGRERYDTSSLRQGVLAGAAMPAEALREFEEQFGVVILEGYGLSETTAAVCSNRSREERKAGSIGLPIWGIELKVFDSEDREVPRGEPGELVVRGHAVMKGYYKRDEATREAMRSGWFHTGDVATMDEDGFVYIVDRLKDMIIRGEYNVYPREIEEILYQHPAVAECAVVGVPHSELGEEVQAIVALKPKQSATEQEIISFAKERAAAYKYPRLAVFMDELPKTATGKILKRKLISEAQRGVPT